jgi:hypothetical protein
MTVIIVPAILACLGTASASGAGRAITTRPPALDQAPRPPLTVRWTVRSVTETQVDLLARIEFAVPVQGLDLAVTVPSGLRLLEGPVAAKVSAPQDLSPIEIPYRFAIAGSVIGEVVISLDLAAGSAFHAEDAYRPAALRPAVPARSEPKVPELQRNSPN